MESSFVLLEVMEKYNCNSVRRPLARRGSRWMLPCCRFRS